MKTLSKVSVRETALSGIFLTLCLFLPFLTGQIPEIGKALSPMHIPVFLCGFICGWQYGALVGFVAPLLRSIIFGSPLLFPAAVAMAFELAVYGLATGLLYKLLPKNIPYIYVSLVAAMLAGRAVWGAARFLIAGFQNTAFPLSAFWAGAFTNAVPGIICHIVLIPLIVIALRKARLIE